MPQAFEDFLKTSLDVGPSLTPTQPVPKKRARLTAGMTALVTTTALLVLAAGTMMAWSTQDKPPTPLERARTAAQRVSPKSTQSAFLAAQPAPPPSQLTRAPAQLALNTLRAPRISTSEINDSIRSQAMAPRRPTPDDIQLYLQARKSTHAMELRTGPGTEFALMGLADLDERYPVIEVKDRWFRIQLEETPGLTAWVAYERVELFSQDKMIGDTR